MGFNIPILEHKHFLYWTSWRCVSDCDSALHCVHDLKKCHHIKYGYKSASPGHRTSPNRDSDKLVQFVNSEPGSKAPLTEAISQILCNKKGMSFICRNLSAWSVDPTLLEVLLYNWWTPQRPNGHFHINPQTGRILASHKGPTWASEAQVISHLYICNNQTNITYHAWFNKYKTKNNQYKWIRVAIDCTFFIKDTKATKVSNTYVGPLCKVKILAIWG